MPNETKNSTHKCPVCQTEIAKPEIVHVRNGFIEGYFCQRCGEYWLDDSIRGLLIYKLNKDLRKIATLSHWIRTKYESKSPPDAQGYTEHILLSNDLVDNILKLPLPKPAEQADNIVRWLGGKIPGEPVAVKPEEQLSIMGAETINSFELIIEDLLNRRHLLRGDVYHTSAGLEGNIILSFEGWEYYEELKRGTVDSHKAFMAMKYNDGPLNKIVAEVFKPAVKQTGFDLIRLDDRPKAGLIDDRLRVEIQTSRFLIADLTHDNLGAYWEAGYAEGLGKPVIYTCEKSKFEKDPPHFDTNHHLTIPCDEKNPQEAAKQLKATIRATLPEQAKLTDD